MFIPIAASLLLLASSLFDALQCQNPRSIDREHRIQQHVICKENLFFITLFFLKFKIFIIHSIIRTDAVW